MDVVRDVSPSPRPTHTRMRSAYITPMEEKGRQAGTAIYDPRDPMRSAREAQRGTRGQGEMRARTYAFSTRGSAGTVTNTQNLARISPRVRSTVTHAPIQSPRTQPGHCPPPMPPWEECSSLGDTTILRSAHQPGLKGL